MMKSYNLNNLVELRVSAPGIYLEFFDSEYGSIVTDSPVDGLPRVSLTVVDDLPPGDRREIRFKSLFSFRYAIRNLASANPEILFERHWLDRLYLTPLGAFIQGQLLEPIVYLKLLERDVLFMHAAGVTRDGKAYVFPAHGGTGKTTLALSLARDGFDLLGDDLLMIHAISGRVYPYARPLHLFTYNLRTLRVPLFLKAAIRSKDLLRVLLNCVTGERFLIATRARVEDLMPVRFGAPSELHRMIFLRKDGDTLAIELITEEARRHAAEAIIESADLNESLRANIADEQWISELETKVVMLMLERISRLEFIKPRDMNEEDRSKFAKALPNSSNAIASPTA